MDNISLVETDQIESKVQMIIRQTDYSEDKAREKLQHFNYNELNVIKDYMGITEKKAPAKITSVNQAIYKELRTYLNSAMSDYHERVDKGEVKKVV
jgi:hypothetical protein